MIRHSGSSHLPQQLKFTTSDSCDRIKDEFQLLQAQYHRYVLPPGPGLSRSRCTGIAPILLLLASLWGPEENMGRGTRWRSLGHL
ncbi:hypothetical protein IHE44_0009989 [Lamprotornis superbus]|uniref:Groucho/TLE N-terminal Q-rich domain-containing protein n=1 Tax=Lamprotornis superbus TaxID=245042 RepID=A0A835TMW8_9PASS|nr:hypothetical protein IHE44_0009989 [Lamprotornis superbus]